MSKVYTMVNKWEEIFYCILSLDIGNRKRAALDLSTPIEMLCCLSNDENEFVRSCVARNPNTPARILDNLSRDESYRVYVAVVDNRSTPKEIVGRLIYGDSFCVKRNIANYTENEYALEELASDSNHIIQQIVAGNCNTPEDVLRVLSLSSHAWIRQAVAENPTAPIEILERLTNDENRDVLMNVMNNSKATKYILHDLTFSKFSSIVEEANYRLVVLRRAGRITSNGRSIK